MNGEIRFNNHDEVISMPTLRYMTNDDQLAYRNLCTICYGYTNTETPEILSDELLHRHRGVFDEKGQLLSAMMEIPYDVSFCGQKVKLVGIGGVVTDPAARRGGNIRRIFEADLPRLYEEGHVLSALYPFSFRFYGKFGYTWAEFWQGRAISCRDIRADLQMADEILRVLPDEDDQGMKAIYEKYIADKNLAVYRDEWMWKDIRRGTPWADLKHAYVLRIAGEPMAYWVGKLIKGDGENTLSIKDMAWTCPRGRDAIFAMFRSMNELGNIEFRAQSGFDPRYVVAEAYDVSEKGGTPAMVRVINVEKALALLPAPPLPGTLTIAVQDEQIAQNCGTFTVISDGTKLIVQKKDTEEADVRCDIRGLSALVVGRERFADALEYGVAELKNLEKMTFAELLFQPRKIHMNHNF